MKTFTIRLPDALMARIETQARERSVSKAEVVRELLSRGVYGVPSTLDAIADLIGSVEGGPPDLSGQHKHHLAATSYGRKRPR